MRRDYLIHAAILAGCFEGSRTPFREIAESFTSIDDIFLLGRQEAVRMCPPLGRISDKLFSKSMADAAAREIDWALDNNLKIVTIEDSDYPFRLRECPDAPLMLYIRGKCDFSRPRFISIVGTRAATQYGRRYCDRIVEHLAHCGIKPVVVSGLALGIDTYAHTFALRYGLDTVAVMGTGFNTIYPPANEQLASEIICHGALVTEFSPSTPSYPLNFVRRNRIIAALSDCTLVVESKLKGGGLITARLAQDYDRCVFAVPGRIDDNTFRGCNALIEDNVAAIATGADSIVKAMDWGSCDAALPLDFGSTATSAAVPRGAGTNYGPILEFIRQNPESDVRAISTATGLHPRELSLPLLEMELSGAISIVSGNKYCAN